MRAIDHATFSGLNAWASTAWGGFWEKWTYLGEAPFALVLLGMVWWWAGKPAWRAWWKDAMKTAGFITAVILALKWGLDRARPAAVLDAASLTILGPVLNHHSFPSGHSATTAWVAGMAFFFSPRWRLRVLALGVAGSVGISRVVVGAHFPLDVLGAWMIVGAVFVVVYGKRRQPSALAGRSVS